MLAALVACTLTGPSFAPAAIAATLSRIGVLCDEPVPYFFDQLRELGYVEHRDVEFLFKGVDVSADVDGFASKAVQAGVRVIVACGNEQAVAAKKATTTIPIVLLYGIVPVETNLVASLPKPGGNVTGSAAISTELAVKSVEMMKIAIPSIRRLAVVFNPDEPVGAVLYAAAERAGSSLGLSVNASPVRAPSELPSVLASLARGRPDAILVNPSARNYIDRIIEFAADQRIPVMYPFAPALRSGGLMSYSPDWLPQSRRNAVIVDRILKGAAARDIPMEQPVRYSFGINMKAARAIGLDISSSVRMLATTVID